LVSNRRIFGRYLFAYIILFFVIVNCVSFEDNPDYSYPVPTFNLPKFPETLENLHESLYQLLGPLNVVGLEAKRRGLRAHHPIILVPGFSTSALQLWEGEACAKKYFRERLWGSAFMLRQLVLDTKCWLRHMKLSDEYTGLETPGIKLRAASGLEAADYFIGRFCCGRVVVPKIVLKQLHNRRYILGLGKAH
jgi:hypothetical protein